MFKQSSNWQKNAQGRNVPCALDKLNITNLVKPVKSRFCAEFIIVTRFHDGLLAAAPAGPSIKAKFQGPTDRSARQKRIMTTPQLTVISTNLRRYKPDIK